MVDDEMYWMNSPNNNSLSAQIHLEADVTISATNVAYQGKLKPIRRQYIHRGMRFIHFHGDFPYLTVLVLRYSLVIL